jgi:hypothetical protein
MQELTFSHKNGSSYIVSGVYCTRWYCQTEHGSHQTQVYTSAREALKAYSVPTEQIRQIITEVNKSLVARGHQEQENIPELEAV